MKYIVMDQIKDGDLFTKEFDDEMQAKLEADRIYNQLSVHDKARREYIHVLESVNPDEAAINHFDGRPIYARI